MYTIILLTATLALPSQQPTSAKRSYTVIRNNHLLEQMTHELAPKHLHAVYGKELRIGSITTDPRYPGSRDTVLVLSPGLDKLSLYTSHDNSFLLKANLTSQRLAFGKGVRVGISKAAFCKAYKLSSAFDTYHIVSSPEGFTDIGFVFRSGILVRVVYEISYVD